MCGRALNTPKIDVSFLIAQPRDSFANWYWTLSNGNSSIYIDRIFYMCVCVCLCLFIRFIFACIIVIWWSCWFGVCFCMYFLSRWIFEWMIQREFWIFHILIERKLIWSQFCLSCFRTHTHIQKYNTKEFPKFSSKSNFKRVRFSISVIRKCGAWNGLGTLQKTVWCECVRVYFPFHLFIVY